MKLPNLILRICLPSFILNIWRKAFFLIVIQVFFWSYSKSIFLKSSLGFNELSEHVFDLSTTTLETRYWGQNKRKVLHKWRLYLALLISRMSVFIFLSTHHTSSTLGTKLKRCTYSCSYSWCTHSYSCYFCLDYFGNGMYVSIFRRFKMASI